MQILSIGNSFSKDAQRYLHQIAKADGASLDAFNLYIGGCPLSKHYRNMLGDSRSYMLEMNGAATGFFVSIKEALLSRDWNVVTLQQVSSLSPYYETYQPYLDKIAEYIHTCVPKAKIAIHQTWAYEQDSRRLNSELGYNDQADMFRDIKSAYKQAAEAVRADILIPSGELFQKLIASGIEKVHRDTFHASYGLGRYALSLLWYSVLTAQNAGDNSFSDFDEDVSEYEAKIAKSCVNETLKQYTLAFGGIEV